MNSISAHIFDLFALLQNTGQLCGKVGTVLMLWLPSVDVAAVFVGGGMAYNMQAAAKIHLP